jgi:hypothetical protein
VIVAVLAIKVSVSLFIQINITFFFH